MVSEAIVATLGDGVGGSGRFAAGMQNDYYDVLEAYVHVLGEALRVEFTAVANAGFTLQIDAPDLALDYVEHPEVVADRIERIAQVVGDPQRLIAGTDCGFETAAGSKMVIEGVVWAKLRSLVKGATIASKRLHG